MERWRLILGGGAADGTGATLRPELARLDETLAALYEPTRGAGLGSSAPRLARWLGDVRAAFPRAALEVLERDALDRTRLCTLLDTPELLDQLEPTVHLAANLLMLARAVPAETRASARALVRGIVGRLRRHLEPRLRASVRGGLQRAAHGRRGPTPPVDLPRTLRRNLKHWDARGRRLVLERLIGKAHARRALHEVVVCLDQSGSMAASVIYASVCASVLAGLPALRTRLVAFDTAPVDLSEHLHDPVDLLFGAQLGGGTDIGAALRCCRAQITRPERAVLVLISDLFDGGDPEQRRAELARMRLQGVRIVCVLALGDDGVPAYDRETAAELAALSIPAFACTPDRFADLMGAALAGQDLRAWAQAQGYPSGA